ncbi:MAG TPA: DedA family protein [Stellaceae bacterium]|nr:DedA family protein [Stellaceae bacterium]
MDLHAGIEHAIHEYGTAAVGLGLFLEHFGLPLPGETLLIGAAVLASKNALSIKLLLVVAWAAATLGNMLGFAIGRYGGHWLVVRYGARVGITPEKLAEVEALFTRYGDAVIVGARFVVLLRQLSGIAAGVFEMNWRRFVVFNAIGAALWVAWWGLASYWLGRRVFTFTSQLAGLDYALFALAAAVLVAVVARLYWRRRRARTSP